MRKRMWVCVCVCDWVTLLCNRKLKEHCKSAIMEKTKIIIKEIRSSRRGAVVNESD